MLPTGNSPYFFKSYRNRYIHYLKDWTLSEEMNARPSPALIQCAGTVSTHQPRRQLHEMQLCKVSLCHFSPSWHVKSMTATRSLEKKISRFTLAQFLKSYTPPLHWYQMEWCILHFLRLHASTASLKLAQFFMQQSQSPMMSHNTNETRTRKINYYK